MHVHQPLKAEQLRALVRQNQSRHDLARLQHRLDCVLLVAEGQGCDAVGRWFGVDRRTIQRWVHDAEAYGLASLAGGHRGGRASALDERLRLLLGHDLAEGPRELGYAESTWSGKRLALHLDRVYGVRLGVRSCQRLLVRVRRGCWPDGEEATA